MSGLIIRRNERHEISLPAKVRIAFSHSKLVKFNKTAGCKDGWLDVHLIDFSVAGIGFITDTFFPRGAMIEIKVADFDGPDTESESEVLIQCEMRVMRVQMTDRRPAYLIGGAFSNIDNQLEEHIESLMLRLEGEGDHNA